MARIEVNTLAENQNIMFDEFRKLLGDKVTNDPRSALYMLLFPISLLARHKNEKIQTTIAAIWVKDRYLSSLGEKFIESFGQIQPISSSLK